MHLNSQYLVNGESKSHISLLDRGFTYGDGVFRTMLVTDGVLKNWDLHYEKLCNDCDKINISCFAKEKLIHEVGLLLNELDTHCVIKIIITRGEGSRGYKAISPSHSNRVIVKSTVPQYPDLYYSRGIDLHLCKLRLSEQPLLAGIKHLNRLENVLARSEWDDENLADGVMLDSKDNVIECVSSNIFARFDDVLATPDLSRCGVAGVTRARIMSFANELRLKLQVMDISLDTLMSADDVIICNSLLGACQVNSFNNKLWPLGNLAKKIQERLVSF